MTEQYNAGDPKHVAKKAQANLFNDLQDKEDLKTIINTPAGFRYFKRMLDEAQVLEPSMTGNSWTYYMEGFKAHAKLVMKELMDAAPQKLIEIFTIEKELDEDGRD
jgi:hypothetical protein